MSSPDPGMTDAPQIARLLLLREAVRTFNSSLDLDVVFQGVLEKVTSVLSAEAASIWLIQDGQRELVCETAIGPVRDRVKGLRLPYGEGIVGWVSQHARPVIVADAQRDKFLSRKVDSGSGYVTRTMICAPMIVRGKCLGAIQIVNKFPDTTLFTQEDLDTLAELAIDAAIAVENARLHEAASKVKELQALLKISREIASTLDLDRVLKTVVNILSTVVPYDRGAVALRDGDRLTLNALSGQEKVEAKDEATRALHAFMSRFADLRETTYMVSQEAGGPLIAQAQAAPLEDAGIPEYMRATGACSLLLVPLRDEEGALGLLYLEARTPGAFTASQLEIVSILAGQVTVAIRNAMLYRQVPGLSLAGLHGALAGSAQRRQRAMIAAGTAGILLALMGFVQLPLNVSGPAQVAPVRQLGVVVQEGGLLREVLVQEGQEVGAGQVVARLDDRELVVQVAGSENELTMARHRIEQGRMASDAGTVALETLKVQQLEAELALLRTRQARTVLLAPEAGVVITPRLREKLGAYLGRGDELLKLASTRELTVELPVAEADVEQVELGMPVAVRMLAYPTHLFEGKVALISPEGKTEKGVTKFTVAARLDNAEGLLKAGMQGHARIAGRRQAIGALLLRAPWSWWQLTWWGIKP